MRLRKPMNRFQQAIITMQIILKAMQAKRITNRDSVQCTAKLPQHGKPGHLMRHP